MVLYVGSLEAACTVRLAPAAAPPGEMSTSSAGGVVTGCGVTVTVGGGLVDAGPNPPASPTVGGGLDGPGLVGVPAPSGGKPAAGPPQPAATRSTGQADVAM